ncbi:MAG: Integral rane protein TerC family protein [Symbiobacteriaceae bacterium]|jgi:YjbE family integral membrane protein|nr:Integral rane protein TerC family protein [Symbiobacteriaceae bacterium]
MIDFMSGLLKLILIDLVLSGDNALVIGMACAALPPRERKLGVLYGSLAAVAMRVMLAAGTSVLLRIPLLQAFGGLLLLWVAYKLTASTAGAHGAVQSSATVWQAVKTIAVADLVMSLDNVLAVGGVSHGNITLLLIGLGLTIPLIMWGSGLVAALLDRAPWLTYVGSAVLCLTAAEMIGADPAVPVKQSPWLAAAAIVLVLGAALWDRRRNWAN